MQPERDFAAWLDRRDAEAIARVFDATGGKLLLLAAHLAGSGERAQDLVQATFLAAIARGASWDRARPLWPWLAAILHNELLMERRRGRRRREVDLADAHAAASEAPGPQQLAASEEALAAVLRAIEALPLPYRQVLRLRLVHGLRPVDIARSLEVPVGTVRAQLHRGLEQLRSALPLGVAGLVGAMFVGDGALLAQVRVHVLEAATGSVVATSAAVGVAKVSWLFGGWLPMNGKTIAVAAGALVLLSVLAWGLGLPPSLAAPPQPLASATPAQASPPSSPRDAPPASDALARSAVEAGDAPAWSFAITVITPDHAPVPGAHVRVWSAPSGGTFWNRDATVFLTEEIAAGETGADGVFRTGLDGLRSRATLARRTTSVWAEASWPHGESRMQGMQLPVGTEPQTLAVTLELRRSRGLTGRVVDPAGAPLACVQVGTLQRDRLSNNLSLSGYPRTDADGAFFIACREEAESWPTHLVLTDERHGTAVVAVPPRDEAPPVVDFGTVALSTGDVVRGQFVLGDGSAIAGLQVNLSAIDASLGTDLAAIHKWLSQDRRDQRAVDFREGRVARAQARTNTLADGTFQFGGLDPRGTYYLDVFGVGELVEAVVKPGGEPIVLRVDKQVLMIDVVDEHGTPLAGARLRIDGYDPNGKRPCWDLRPGFPEVGEVVGNWTPSGDPAGRRFVLSPFGFVWYVGVADQSVQATFLRHEALPGVSRATCRLELHPEMRFGKLHVVAVDENGAPIHFGASAKCVGRDLAESCKGQVIPPEGWTWELPAGQWDVDFVMGKQVIYLWEGGYARGNEQRLVTVEDGRTTEVRVVAKPAGLVAFELTSTSPPDVWLSVRAEAAGKAVALVDNAVLAPRLGERLRYVTKQALPPGKHTFVVFADGYQSATCTADVVVDKLAVVRVELQPK